MKTFAGSSQIAKKNFIKQLCGVAGTDAMRAQFRVPAEDESFYRIAGRRGLNLPQFTISATFIGEYRLGIARPAVHQRAVEHGTGT